MKKKGKTIVLVAIFIIGLCILLYPAVSQYINSKSQSKVILDYERLISEIDTKDYSDIFEKANEYNQQLLKLDYPLIQYRDLSNYSKLLNVNNDGMMGYITIDKIDVKLPIYHGTEASVLNVAVGHMEGSSLPVGGNSTHSILSAHRGLPTSRLFTDLNKVEIGDIFQITVLNQKLTYQVDNIEVVEPEDISNLEIEKDKDYVTLVTCTPYGLNTHRLLIRGTRIENPSDYKVYVTTEAFKINSFLVATIISIPLILILLIILLLKPVKNKNKGKTMEVKNNDKKSN